MHHQRRERGTNTSGLRPSQEREAGRINESRTTVELAVERTKSTDAITLCRFPVSSGGTRRSYGSASLLHDDNLNPPSHDEATRDHYPRHRARAVPQTAGNMNGVTLSR